jgi:alkanesulfonate monooxygenase SsuD/methylene tetrahydromethanopterin reductase-like flavin-dependent oxidoreductase (luciferase family)
MKFGIDIPNYGDFGHPRVVLELAQMAEEAGWDGFFIWDHLVRFDDPNIPMVDPWIALAAVAAVTERIRFGTMVTPLARRRPWKVARETVSLDHLSQGRLILGVGLGSRSRVEFGAFGDSEDPRQRAKLLDESLDILVGLWSGEDFEYQGEYYRVGRTRFKPSPLQKPRIPIWVAGTWPHKRPFQRAARWDGAFPLGAGRGHLEMMRADEIAEVKSYLRERRQADQPFDLVHLGITPGTSMGADANIVKPYGRAGATWWLENLDLRRAPLGVLQERVRRGPPMISI